MTHCQLLPDRSETPLTRNGRAHLRAAVSSLKGLSAGSRLGRECEYAPVALELTRDLGQDLERPRRNLGAGTALSQIQESAAPVIMPTAGANSPANARPGMRRGLDLSGLESEREGREDVADDGGCDVDEFVVEHDHLSNAREERMDLVVRGLGCGRGEDRDAVSHLAGRTCCGAIDGPIGICVAHDFERGLGKGRHDDGRVRGDRSGDRGELSGLVAENDHIGIPGDRRVVRERLPASLGRQFGSTSRVGSGA
jgi:hypothetical protein